MNARNALQRIEALYGLRGEIVVADNGSTDGSQELAASLGARLVPVALRGYGAAIIGGCTAAAGCFLLIGDADGSYDFGDGIGMIGALTTGADLCIGSRFKGAIRPGAMPWKNRYIGNPFLTGVLNLLFQAGVDDAHCGLRALTKPCFERLKLRGSGMEFASEMIIKAALLGERIAEVPVTLHPDLRDRAPHLRPWRDGWRHLRYLVMLSPTWAFGVPALLSLGIASLVLFIAGLHFTGILSGAGMFGTSWTIVAGFLFTSGHFAGLMAFAMHLHSVREGYRELRPSLRRVSHLLTLESLISTGLLLVLSSIALLMLIAYHWSGANFTALPSVLPLVLASIMGATGLQTIFGGFVLAIVGGHNSAFASDLEYGHSRPDSKSELEGA